VSDAARLLAAFDSGELLRPAAGEPNTVDLSLAVAHACGVEGIDLTPAARAIAERIGGADHIVLLLLDGFGMHLAEREPPDSPLNAGRASELRTVFPSSTAPALTSLATGLWPARHALPGWWTHLPSEGLTSTILPFIDRFSEQPLAGRVRVEVAYPAPTLMSRYARSTRRVLPRNIDGSIYSRYANATQSSFGYTSLRQAARDVDATIAAATSPTYTYFYAPFIDTAEHEHGPDSAEVKRVVKRVRQRVRELTEFLAGRARIIITADHGQIAGGTKHTIDRNDALMNHLVVPPSCEPRAAAFHVRPGHHDAFAAAFRHRLGPHFSLLGVAEVEELRLLGPLPMTPETRARIGDFMAMPMNRDVLLYEPGATLAAMQGFHGGLLPDEMRVPLIVI
jgi:hypothetical protein